jgi:Na+/melibiose symporter-like transporter
VTIKLMPVYNLLVIMLSLIGFVRYAGAFWRSHRLFLITLLIMMIGSAGLFALKPPEERLTVPLYPVLFLFAGLGGEFLFRKFSVKFSLARKHQTLKISPPGN